jgi:uncharacterized membrane protein
VRRSVKVVVWVLVFAACAGAGAVVAAHTDPFSPGVEDPGSRSPSGSVRPTGSPVPPQTRRWAFSMPSDTRHEFHVGGTCRTSWNIEGSFEAAADGVVHGGGTATLSVKVCDFPEVQIQARSIQLQIRGTVEHEVVRLRFAEAGRDPVGSKDLGGLTNTLRAMRPRVSLDGEADGRVRFTVQKSDGDLGRYVSENRLRIACRAACR